MTTPLAHARVTKLIQEIPRSPLQNYRNTAKVMTIKGQPVYVETIARAALVSRSNMLLLGARGKGKTTLEHDVLHGIFGGVGTYIRMHPKMDEKELFSHLNLGKYFRGEVSSSKELREIIDAIHNNCIVVDEITRGPGITQNRLFGLADGYIDLDGVIYPLGNGYTVLIASGNEGDEYYGTFALDGALIDRFPVILNMDDFCPQAQDTFLRLMKKHDPRVPHVKETLDISQKLKEIHREVSALEASIIMAITAQYLITGLGDCSKRGYPKLMIKKSLPKDCQGCAKLAEGCGYHMGISERWGEALVGFTIALQQVVMADYTSSQAESRAGKGIPPFPLVHDDIVDVLEVFKTFAGNTGIVNAQHVLQKHLGNPYLFMSELAAKVKGDFDSRMEPLLKVIGAIERGEAVTESMLKPFTDDVSAGAGTVKLKNPWRFVKGLVGV
jgi:MoxR-like ATPase